MPNTNLSIAFSLFCSLSLAACADSTRRAEPHPLPDTIGDVVHDVGGIESYVPPSCDTCKIVHTRDVAVRTETFAVIDGDGTELCHVVLGPSGLVEDTCS